MSDVRWYYDQPDSEWDVSTFRPKSAPPVYREGGWNFNASPTELLNLGKYMFKGLGGLKDMLGLGSAAPSGMPSIMEGSMGGVEDLLGNALDFAPTAGLTSALPSGLGSAMEGSMGGVEELLGNALSFAPATQAPAAAPIISALSEYAAPSGMGSIMGGSMGGVESFLPGASGGGGFSSMLPGLSTSPMLYAAALPAAFYAMKELFGKDFDPMTAVRSQFGTENPTAEALNEYFTNPGQRTVPVMDIMPGMSRLGYGDQTRQALTDAGLWDPTAGRWSNNMSAWMPGETELSGGVDYNPLTGGAAAPGQFESWQAYNDYADQLIGDKIVGARTRRTNPGSAWTLNIV